MAKRSTKFGTFGGVFTPSILTILGVIMYLRLPWVVGNGGLWVALGVIAAAHLISVMTGLSISSIATDKKVGAGGPYYIVSRSLGLPIGGTLGLALFVGLSFSISLYVIGFSESFLAQLGYDGHNIDNIRICGTITIILLTVVTLISTSFAIKTQYVILGAIALSLISIALSPGAPPAEGMHLKVPENGASIAMIFGIFFPAVTGFTAGVNMSGDLRDPKKSIPVGTMAAISTGLVVYVSLALFLAWKIPVNELQTNSNALADHARWGFLVIAGIWGATLSSGLGSIMGAPRILQALSRDRVTPVWLAKGHGKDNEPRRALLIAFAIGEAGILIGDLNAIARVVSIFFIATYGFLNLSCAIESWASTDFRPEFRIPRTFSVVGALVCVLMMIQLDIAATAAASLVFIGLFAWLKRRELALESGDTWAGVWSSLVRWGLEQLDAGGRGQRSWRPNVLSFSWRELQDHGPLLAFGNELIRDRGVLTDFRLRTSKDRREEAAQGGAAGEQGETQAQDDDDGEVTPIAGRFAREVETEDPWATVRSIAQFHGFAGLEPNTVLINWAEQRHDRAGFAKTLDELVALDFSLLLLARDPKRDFGTNNRVDLWWTPTQGSFELEMALIRFLSMSDDWRRSELRFLLLNDDPSRGDALFKSAQRALADARIQGAVKVFNNAIGNRPLYDWVRQESGDADLVVLGLPAGPLAAHPEQMLALDQLCDDIGSVLVTRGASQFEPVLQRVGHASRGGHGSGSRVRDDRSERSLTADELDAVELIPLRAPEPGELKAAARELSLAHDELATEFSTECLGLIYAHDAALIEQLRGVVDRAFDQLGKALGERVLLRQRKQLNKIQSGFLFQARRALSEFESDRLTAQVDALEHRVEGWLTQLNEIEREAPKTLTVARDPQVLAPSPEDVGSLRRAKRRLRVRHLFQGPQLSYGFNATPLYGYYLRYRSRSALALALNDMALDGYQVLLEIGRSMSEARHALDEFALRLVEIPASRSSKGGVKSEPSGTVSLEPSGTTPLDPDEPLTPRERAKQELAARIAERRELVLERLDKLLARTLKRSEQSRDQLLHASRSLAQAFADDTARLDVQAVIRNHRRVPKQAQGLDASLLEAAAVWRKNRQLVLNRASLELHNAGFQQRLRAIVERTKDSTTMTIQAGILRGASLLRESLVEYRKAIEAGPEQAGEGSVEGGVELAKLRFTHELGGEFDDKRMVEELAREAQAASSELPDAIEVIGDDALTDLEDHPFEETEVLTVSLRRLVDFMVQAEFLGGLREHTARVALAEQRAVGVAQDVLHLVSFNLSEYEAAHADVELSLAERVGPVIANGLGRLDGELEQLRTLASSLGDRIDAQLGKILDRTEAYVITGSEDSFKLYVRHEQSGGALSKVGGATRWAQRLSKRVLVRLLYRWSAGVLLARRIQTAERGNVVEQVLEFVNANSPKPEVLDALPFYYSQPFLGQARVSMEFWVGREAEIDDIAGAVRNWRQGRKGALLIVGEGHSGKTSLARYTARKHFEKRNKYNILPPRGGSADGALFKSRLEKELKLSPELSRSWDDIMTAIPTGSVVMIHDLELWWERSLGGVAVLEQLSELIDRYGDRVLFILELNVHAYRYISRTVPLGDQALAVVECQPFTAEQLKDVIEGRHRSTGLRGVIDGRDEDELPAWNRARLFTRHFDYSAGYVGVALHSWITHVDRLEGEDLVMRSPKTPTLEPLERLKLEWVALLLQFVLHKRLTRARLVRITGLDAAALDRALDTLARMGLISEDKQGVVELNHYVSHLLVASLRARGYL
ncbi:amino acid permease [Enhygromyxa salina]|uniref:Putative fructoselysine transporter n=1 Tax=Enhygromyxa salina TaxID=215803 RepID=A0A2S9YWG4_9BACT|nr:amino acid permease [Enhygromyxa salina]PRQ09445.1 putative fructoselysine transporter [Enhygromyxa salina]